MPTQTKLSHYTELQQNSITALSQTEKWQSFLETSARLYKYGFKDQAMIHAQRPNATACADYDLWRRADVADRQVMRGSKGIALVDNNGEQLRYVFDYADTEARSNKQLKFWQINAENEDVVCDMLKSRYGVGSEELDTAIMVIAQKIAAEYASDFANELVDYTGDSFLADYDDYNVYSMFSQTLENSIAYSLLSRCGYDPAEYFDKDDFEHLYNFNTVETMTILGRSVSEMSEVILRDIERTVKTHERNKVHEQDISTNTDRNDVGRNRTDVSVGRGNGNISAEPVVTGATETDVLRQDDDEVSEGNENGSIRNNAHQGNSQPVLDGIAGDSGGERSDVALADVESGGSGREIEGSRPDEMGAVDEQPSPESAGDSRSGIDSLLTADSELIGGFLSPETLKTILKSDWHMNVKKPEILEYFLEHDDFKERAEFMKAAYNLDFTLVEVGEDKILFSYQKTADGLDVGSAHKRVRIPWHDVQERVANLIAKHEYIDNDFMIAGDLDSPAFSMPETEQLSLFGEETEVESTKPTKSAKVGVSELTELDKILIKAEFMRGGGTEDSKFRIVEFAEQNPSTTEFAKFLSKEYGIGGGSRNAPVKFTDHNGKGIHLRITDENAPDGERKISFSWNTAAKHIAKLVKDGEYITDDDISRRIKNAEYVINNYDPADSYDAIRIEQAEKILAQYGLFDDGTVDVAPVVEVDVTAPKAVEVAEVVPETTVFTEEDYVEYIIGEGDILERDDGIYEVVWICDGELKLKETTTDEIVSVSEDELYNTGFAVIEQKIKDDIAVEVVDDVFEVADVETSEPSQPEEIDPQSLIGKHYIIDGREMIVENIDFYNKVSFADVESFNNGYPIFRSEPVSFLLYIEQQERDKQDIDITDIAVIELVSEVDVLELPEPATVVDVLKTTKLKGENYKITDENLGVGCAKSKFQNNIEAIKLLKEIEHEQHYAPVDGVMITPEQQEILSRYVGWGGMAQAFDKDNAQWANEYLTLKNTLSDYEYDCARESTLNAHYTSPTVIKAIYDGLDNLGFKTGNILEPAMGVGNFFGMLPENMSGSKLYGVELDDISGRIAKQLYPNADISIRGFESKPFSDNFFDVACGNVPFGGYKLSEKRYDKLNLNVHDHFFAKAIDKVRPGGVVAFVTSKGTLDKQDSKFRKYLSERAELLGAVRLPNTAFKANAGTEVTSDIIFLQKRESVMDIEPEWVKTGKYISPANAEKIAALEAEIEQYREANYGYGQSWETRQKNNEAIKTLSEELKELRESVSLSVNNYFLSNPDMLLGTMERGATLYGNENETTCVPFEGADLSAQLKAAIANIKGEIPEYVHEQDTKLIDSIPADERVKNFSFTLVEDKIYYRENSRMNRVEFPKATEERIKAMVELRDCVRELIHLQLNEYGESAITAEQFKLNNLYDKFNKKHGLINSSANKNAFKEDDSYYLLCSLEILNEQGALERKADMFTKRTIKQRKVITTVDTASEALAVSIAEKARVDLDFMSELSTIPREKLIEDLRGVIYQIPFSENYVTADEYLSGNIREKLAVAKSYVDLSETGGLQENVKALEQAMPKPLEASDIDVRLGVNWVETSDIKQFICETLQVPYFVKQSLDVKYSKFTAEWHVEGKNTDPRNVLANTTFGTGRKNAYSIIEDTLNLRDVRIFDYEEQPDGSKKAILNKKETMLAQEKQETLKQSFKDWIFKDPDRREQLVEKYNELFNSTRPREYDGSHINFVGMNPEITLNPHQRNAVAHALYGGNTLFAHCVGAGKTYEMVATAMESKRLGLCNKSMICVPNHISEQIGSDFLRLYPSANILVATKKDFETKNRRRLCAKIACGDYDAVIIGHSQLEKIPVSQERQERLLRKQIHDITSGIEEIKNRRGEKFSVKQLEKTKKSLEAKLKKLIEAPKRDDVVTFEELGVDKLFIDESHNFKNLFLYTKMRNVAGVQQTEAQKSTDLYMKCQYLDELTGGKGLCFSTGTPISNSMSEMYTVMRYLQADQLRKHNLEHFDSWAATFGETTTSMELAPEGGGYRARTRFAKFFNLPELMNIFKECADIKTVDMLPDLKVPEVEFHNVVVKPTEHQKEMVADLSERAKLVHEKSVPPEQDNMLCICNDGRKIGLDQRLLNPLLPDEPNTKVNVCVENIHNIYTENNDKKSTQLVFCDFSTPKNDGSFNVYDDIRNKLVDKGVPKKEITFIHEYDSEDKKKELFARVRKGDVRVLIGSTAKMGAGTNVQNKLIAIHDLDAPWRPADLEQRLGRGKRQGNENEEIKVFRYVTENTFDSYLYQTLENKQRFISQIMTSKSPVRSAEDVDEAVLSYAEVKALCAGNPLIKEKIDLDVSVAKLKALKANHVNEQYRLEDNVLKYFPEAIKKTENRIEGYASDTEHLKSVVSPPEGISPMVIMGTEYTDKEAAGKALIEACKKIKSKETLEIGTYKGFDLSLSYESFGNTYHLEMKRDMTYNTVLGTDPHGNITRTNNVLDNVPKLLENSLSQLEALHSQLETAKGELGKPFSHEDELKTKQARLAVLNIELNIEGKHEVDVSMPIAADKPIDRVADKSPTVTDKIADKPVSKMTIHERMKHFKEQSQQTAQNGQQRNKDKEL